MGLRPTQPDEYEVLAPLGAGGMGEVYRARDTKLGRMELVEGQPLDRRIPEGGLPLTERSPSVSSRCIRPA